MTRPAHSPGLPVLGSSTPLTSHLALDADRVSLEPATPQAATQARPETVFGHMSAAMSRARHHAPFQRSWRGASRAGFVHRERAAHRGIRLAHQAHADTDPVASFVGAWPLHKLLRPLLPIFGHRLLTHGLDRAAWARRSAVPRVAWRVRPAPKLTRCAVERTVQRDAAPASSPHQVPRPGGRSFGQPPPRLRPIPPLRTRVSSP